MITREQFEKLLPIACNWAEQQEEFILKNGTPLDADQKKDALAIGIEKVDKVRLMKVGIIPAPANPELQEAIKITGLLSPLTLGLTLGHGIFIKDDYWKNRVLLAHELTHTLQYERFKGIPQFLKLYLHECITIGYPNGPLEMEARRMEKEFM